uniref:Peptidase A1 domain-containing protein n=1 Tax=Oryza punctata TaxID=4537 RepID=A0A0E0L2D2_ORYPU
MGRGQTVENYGLDWLEVEQQSSLSIPSSRPAAARHHFPSLAGCILRTAQSPPPLAVASSAVLLLFVFVSPCRAAAARGPSAVVLPVSKDDETKQYVATFQQRTPQVPVKAVLDPAGAMLWVDCDDGYVSSSYACVAASHVVPSRAALRSTMGAPAAATARRRWSASTTPASCSRTVTEVSISSYFISDVLSLPTTFLPAPGPSATAPAFLFSCGFTVLTEGLAAGATGMVSLSRARYAFPAQLAATFRFSRRFALCLPPAATAGVVIFGDAPYVFQPGVDISKSLIYTPLLVNPVSTGMVGDAGDKSTEYFIGLTGIKVNGHTVPLNATLLSINKKGVGGTKLSTVTPYTVLEISIHKAVTDAFAAETAMIPRVPAVAPFTLCYDGSKAGSTAWGQPCRPLSFTAASWVVFGANSMVATKVGALCLGVVDSGTEPQTSVVIGGHMMEDNLLEFDLEASRLGVQMRTKSESETHTNAPGRFATCSTAAPQLVGAAAAAVARPPQPVAGGRGLRSVVVRPSEAAPAARSPSSPSHAAPPGKGKGLLSVMVAPASRFRHLEQGQSSRQAHLSPPRSPQRWAAFADADGNPRSLRLHRDARSHGISTESASTAWSAVMFVQIAGRPLPASAVLGRVTAWRSVGSVVYGLVPVVDALLLRMATVAMMVVFTQPNMAVLMCRRLSLRHGAMPRQGRQGRDLRDR